MPWRYSGVEGGPVWIDRHDSDEHELECEECHADLTGEVWEEDDEHVFCVFCYDNIFGKD